MLARTIVAPTSRRSSGSSALTAALVPTGMNWGVSTMPWGSSSRPRRAAVEPSAGGGTRLVNVRRRSRRAFRPHGDRRRRSGLGGREGAIPQGGQSASGRRGGGNSKPCRARCSRPPRSAIRPGASDRGTEPQQVGLVDVLDRLDLLGEHGGERRTPTGPLPNFWTIAASSLRSVASSRARRSRGGRHRLGRGRASTARRRGPGHDRGPVSGGGSRSAACPGRAGRSLRRVLRRPRPPESRRAEDDRGQVLLLVEVQPIVAPKRSRSGPLIRPARVVAPTTVNGLRVRRSDRAEGPLPIITSSAKSSIAG